MTNEIQKEVARIAWAKEFPHLKQVEGYNGLVTAATERMFSTASISAMSAALKVTRSA